VIITLAPEQLGLTGFVFADVEFDLRREELDHHLPAADRRHHPLPEQGQGGEDGLNAIGEGLKKKRKKQVFT
jgi:hypothetical protein